jgi:hypothetical protein
MKAKTTAILLLLLVAALFALTQYTQLDEKIIDLIHTHTEVNPEPGPVENDDSDGIQSRYIHMSDDLADSGLSAGILG